MPTKAYTPSEAAALIKISPSSLRNWCGQFRKFLSAGATPEPGGERILTGRDVAVLQFVKERRDQHRGYDQIIAELEASPPTEDTIYIDTTATPVTESPQQPASALRPVTGTDIALQVVAAMTAQRDDLQRQIDALGSVQADRLTWFAYGLLAGLMLAMVGIGVVWLGWAAR